MVKEVKIINGKKIQLTDEKRTWRCTVKTDTGEIVTLPFEVIAKLLGDCDILVSEYGKHYRAYDIIKI